MYLPEAPSDREKYLYLSTNKWFLYVFGIFSFLVLTSGMVLFGLSSPGFYPHLIFTAITAFYLILSYVIGVSGREFNYTRHKTLLRDYRFFEPSVDVYLPCCGEDINIIENTYRHVKALEYNNFKVYVLDDGKSDQVQALAWKYNFSYIRRETNELKKAGNLRHAFKKTIGELIVIFDADFCPRPDFLKETVPYFALDKTAIVQTPQFFRLNHKMNWIHKGAAYTQELFYRLIQVNRNHFGGSICVGTNAVYRRKALEPMGGTAPIGYSEDVHTGFNIVNAGWNLEYIPINLACGVCPDTLSSFFIQQYRWSMGSITLFLNKEFWTSKLTIMQKICYLTGMLYYITTGLSIFLSPLPSVLVLAFVPESIFWFNSIFAIPSFIFGTVIAALWSKNTFGLYAPKSRAVAYYAHLFALVDKLRNSLVPWEPTGNVKSNARFEKFRLTLFWWNFICLSLTIALSGYRVGQGFELQDLIIMNLFAFYNYYIFGSILRDQE